MKPLKILLGNNTLSLLAGSETWTYTLAVQLKKMGHSVTCFAPELGIISDRLIKEGIPCFDSIDASGVKPFSFILEETVEHKYDVIIANHNNVVEYLRSQFQKTPIISTIHGIIHFMEDDRGNQIKAPEHPALESGVNQFVSVSEEVRDKLKADYGIDSAIIRNFFDISRFNNLRSPSEGSPKQFLINTNYSERNDDLIVAIREAAKHFGAKVTAIGQNFSQSFDITRAINDADVVFGMGRSVLEGVAAGRLGIVHGRWGTGGAICESMIGELRHFNFSGRNSKNKTLDTKGIIDLIERYYSPKFFEWGKDYIAQNHNVVFAAEEYVRLARELTGELILKPKTTGGVASDIKPFRLAKDA